MTCSTDYTTLILTSSKTHWFALKTGPVKRCLTSERSSTKLPMATPIRHFSCKKKNNVLELEWMSEN